MVLSDRPDAVLRAHPRRCGEHLQRRPEPVGFAGSPPAGAGNIDVHTASTLDFWAHPRRCGEHSPTANVQSSIGGSPPQVRGTSPDRPPPRTEIGLTPAGAGNIKRSTGGGTPLWAHPRRCGEHGGGNVLGPAPNGSPPQVRGTSGGGVPRLQPPGLTPAGAGNMLPASRRPAPCGAHPRRCGEHDRPAKNGSLASGSPPQVRGTSVRSCANFVCSRLTPAGAGNMSTSRIAAAADRAHPRRCGEHSRRRRRVSLSPGSPPQVRGTFADAAYQRWPVGLTPAGAGNIPWASVAG